MGSKEHEEMVAKAAKSFPSTFGLRAFQGDRFKILPGESYVSDAVVMLYVGRQQPDDGTFRAFCKGTVSELLHEIVAAPPEAQSVIDYRKLARAMVQAGQPAPAERKAKDLIDAQAAAELRLLLLNRMSWIDEIYPHGQEHCSTERTAALTALIHLTNELGLECEGFLYEKGEGE